MQRTPNDKPPLRVLERRCYVRAAFPAPVGFAVPDGLEAVYWARAVDISAGGICLLLRLAGKIGAELSVTLPLAAGGYLPARPARVMNSTSAPGELWRTGCEFKLPLTPKELEAIIGHD
jgi:hypothetical protein